jgi:hypothetical protein
MDVSVMAFRFSGGLLFLITDRIRGVLGGSFPILYPVFKSKQADASFGITRPISMIPVTDKPITVGTIMPGSSPAEIRAWRLPSALITVVVGQIRYQRGDAID